MSDVNIKLSKSLSLPIPLTMRASHPFTLHRGQKRYPKLGTWKAAPPIVTFKTVPPFPAHLMYEIAY